MRHLWKAIQESERSQVSQITFTSLQSGIASQRRSCSICWFDANSNHDCTRSWFLWRRWYHVKVNTRLSAIRLSPFDSFGTSLPAISSLSNNFNICYSMWRLDSFMLETAAIYRYPCFVVLHIAHRLLMGCFCLLCFLQEELSAFKSFTPHINTL